MTGSGLMLGSLQQARKSSSYYESQRRERDRDYDRRYSGYSSQERYDRVGTTDVGLDLTLLLPELLYNLLPMFLVLPNLLDTSQLLSPLDPSPTIPDLRQCPQ